MGLFPVYRKRRGVSPAPGLRQPTSSSLVGRLRLVFGRLTAITGGSLFVSCICRSLKSSALFFAFRAGRFGIAPVVVAGALVTHVDLH